MRLIGSGTACIFPSNTVTVSTRDITASATRTYYVQDLGAIDVSVAGVPGFYTYRLVRNGVTVDTFGPTATILTLLPILHLAPIVRVETNKCDITISNDVNGNPIILGQGITPLAVAASANESFGCGLRV